MRMQDLLTALYAIEDAHGNCEVHIDDADTGWPLAILEVSFDTHRGWATVRGDYHEQANPLKSIP